MKDDLRTLLRSLPSMDVLLAQPWVPTFERSLGRDAVKSAFADVIGELRRDIRKGSSVDVNVASIEVEARHRLAPFLKTRLRNVVNATGVVVHTNLGRSVLPEDTAQHLCDIAIGYNTLEYDLDEGHRGHRNDLVEWLICQTTGADAALVVNNNAGAILLVLSALAKGKEAIVSRGELVEIGGSFRIPDIMSFSGTKMVEVGTTNRTHLRDFEGAITDETAMLLKVHPSNYRVVGFHSEVPREDLAALAREKDLIFTEDLGSGILVDLAPYGLSGEPTVRQCLMSGVDLITFSGDKLLGGPQIGIIAGRKQLVDRIRNHPLVRALRVDKMGLAALESILRLYLADRWQEIPTLNMLTLSRQSLLERAEHLRDLLEARFNEISFLVTEVGDAVGGGAFPATSLPGFAVTFSAHENIKGDLQKALRMQNPAIIAGAREDRIDLHVRTLLADDDKRIIEALESVIERGGKG